jgi:serine/threonine-protein kinase SRK2
VQRGLPEGDARWLFQQIALAVDFCHRLGIALRDIKVQPITSQLHHLHMAALGTA